MKPIVDFMGIGAQKAATTWLAQNLRQHPDVWIPPRKELHYFDHSEANPSANHGAWESRFGRLFGTTRRGTYPGTGDLRQAGNHESKPD